MGGPTMMQTGRLFIRFFVQVEGNLVNRFFLFCCWEGQNHGRDLLDGRSRWGERGSWWK